MQIRIYLVILFLTISQSVFGSAFFDIGVEGRLIKNVEDNHELKKAFVLSGGYQISPWLYYVEGLYYQESNEATGSYHIKYSHYELTGFAARFIDYDESRVFNIYLGAGAGLLRERITTKIENITTHDDSKIYLQGKAVFGLWANITNNFYSRLEARSMVSDAYSPKVLFGLAFKLGYSF